MPSLEDSQAFGTSWKTWWQSMQPAWRGRNLSRNIPSDANWSPLLYGGANGLFLVILSLAWWIRADRSNNISDDRIADAIEEVSWVLEHLRAICASSKANGKKRQSEVAGQQLPVKRYVFIYTTFNKSNSMIRAKKAGK